jgi:hypothetical protein
MIFPEKQSRKWEEEGQKKIIFNWPALCSRQQRSTNDKIELALARPDFA